MFASARYLCTATVFLTILARCPAADDVLSKEELGKRGKAATALVELKEHRSYGSAFCVHPTGLFLTNEHVVRPALTGGNINLVLDPGLKTQRIYKATVVRSDKDLDLALLRVEGAKDLPTLSLGSDDKLAELVELVACGFPFGTDLAIDKNDYPSVSINVGSVTSLRRKAGELHFIQLDAVLNPGNSGGPVLDRTGKVVGVVVAGVRGAGVNFAIPVGQVLRFVARPDLQVTPPVLDAKNRYQPALFRVRAVAVLPDSKPLAVELILKTGDSPERRHKLEAADGMYQVKAVAVPAPAGPLQVQMAATYDNGTLNALVADRAIKVGDHEVKLSGVRSVHFKPKGRAVLQDGKTLEGAITGLEAVSLQLGDQAVSLNLSQAVEVKFAPPLEVDAVLYTLVVTRDGKEVARVNDSIPIQGIVRPAVAVGPADIKAPVLDGDKVVRQLPATVSDVAVGGGGRYLILQLAKLRKLAVFDVNEAKVVHYIPIAEDNIKFAAGMEDLIVVLLGSNVVQRWSLKTFERDLATPLPIKGVVKSIAMGSASKGPLLIHWAMGTGALDRASFDLLNIQTMKLLANKTQMHGMMGHSYRDIVHIRSSADGAVFGMWCTSHSPSGLATLILAGDEPKAYYEHNSVGHVIPSPDGKVIYTGAGLFTVQAKPMGKREGAAIYLPARQGNYYVSPQAGQKGQNLAVYMQGNPQPLIHLTDIELPGVGEPWLTHDFTFDKRVHFIPEARLIVTIPATDDRLILHRFDLDQALEKSGIDYLLVTSQPPLTVRKGAAYAYQLVVKSKKGGVKYRLESGPGGMAVAADGKLTWQVPADAGRTDVDVIVSIRDSAGQEVFHTFRLGITD